MYKSGFITIIGRPNVGKSTLLNTIIGEKVAIVSDKAQTTRTRIRGVKHLPDAQMVFVDTPGVQNPQNRLGEYMQKVTWSSFDGVEALVVMFHGGEGLRKRDEEIIDSLVNMKELPAVFAVVNFMDHAPPQRVVPLLARLGEVKEFQAVYPISALTGEGVETLLDALLEALPEGPQYFPEDQFTDQPERTLIAELIRESALERLKEEVPHGLGVEIQAMEQRQNGQLEIHATIYCEKESHKGILIGKKGQMLKDIGSAARQEIQRLLASPVHLELWIKVKENWRNSGSMLQTLGYIQD